MKKYIIESYPLILLVLAIGLSARFPVGQLANGKVIDLRIEDILLLIFGALWLCQIFFLKKEKLAKPPLFLSILAWLGIGLFSTLVNLALLNVIQPSRTFFYFLKEIEYFFLFFYVFYHIKSIGSVKMLLKTWVLVGSINAIWVIFQLISGLRFTYYYGPTTFIEPEGTFPGGGFFLILFIFLINVFLYHYLALNMSNFKKVIILILISSLAVGVLSSGSRSSFVGLLVASFASFLIFAIRVDLWRSVLVFGFITIYVLGIFAISLPPALDIVHYTSPSATIARFSNVEEIKANLDPGNAMSRPGIWIHQLRVMIEKPVFFVFGFGKGAILNGLGESHSQYVRNLVETGISGLIIFFILLYNIIKNSLKEFLCSKDTFLRSVSIGLFCSTVAMMTISIFAEGFLVVKINEAYWFFTALTFAVLSLNKKHDANNVLA